MAARRSTPGQALPSRPWRGLLASALGLVLLLWGGSEAAGLRARLSPARLLIGATDAVRAPDGSVFVASDLARVHVYTAQGEPVRGFEVPLQRFGLRIAGPDRLLLLPEDGAPPLLYDFRGRPVDEVGAAERAAPGAPDDLRISGGDVLRVADSEEHVLVRGYPSHWAMMFHVLGTGLCLFAGGLLLVGGAVSTGRRSPS